MLYEGQMYDADMKAAGPVQSGNPIVYYNGTEWNFSWAKGRQLTSAIGDGKTISYTYDMAGVRDSKTVGNVTYHYDTLNGKIVRQTWTENGVEKTFDIIYDANGQPYACEYEGARYYYVCNMQGDVIRILTTVGAKTIVEYQYDAWGNVISITGTLRNTLGKINPIRYRGYYYDAETGFYYLQSRYYDPGIGRFINADSFASTGQDFLGCNMFAYCNNNPIIHHDKTGDFPWLIFGIIVGGGVLGAILGYSSEEKIDAESSNEMPMSRDELKYPSEITEDDLTQPEPAPEEPLTTGDRVYNAFLGGLMGIAGGGLIVFGAGAAATVTVGASTYIPALGATAGQTWAIGAVAYDLVGMIFAPLLGVEMEPIEIEEIEIKPR